MKPRQTKFLTRGIIKLMECGWELEQFPDLSKSGKPATRYALTRGGHEMPLDYETVRHLPKEVRPSFCPPQPVIRPD